MTNKRFEGLETPPLNEQIYEICDEALENREILGKVEEGLLTKEVAFDLIVQNMRKDAGYYNFFKWIWGKRD